MGRPGPRRRSHDAEPQTILLAEDNLEMRRFLASALRRDGYEVIEVKNGADLVSQVADRLVQPISLPPVDLIISDQRMPGFTGLEILGALRTEDWVTPFVLITAFGGEELREEAQLAGAAAVLDKPFDIDDLRTVIVNLIGRARME